MLNVDAVPRYLMTNAPLVQAVAQINFPLVPRFQNLDGAAALLQLLGGELPYLEQQAIQELTIGPAGPVGTPQATNVFVLSGDEGWSLQLTVGTAALIVDGSSYRGSQDFRDRLERVWTALRTTADLRRCDRLGVRYIDIVELDDGDGWAEWFRPEIVGLTAPHLSAGTLASSVTETRLVSAPIPGDDGSPQTQGVIRHGLLPPGTIMAGTPPRQLARQSFLFDMDIAVAGLEGFDPRQLAERFTELHAQLEKVFHWAVTADGRAHFGYELLTDEE